MSKIVGAERRSNHMVTLTLSVKSSRYEYFVAARPQGIGDVPPMVVEVSRGHVAASCAVLIFDQGWVGSPVADVGLMPITPSKFGDAPVWRAQAGDMADDASRLWETVIDQDGKPAISSAAAASATTTSSPKSTWVSLNQGTIYLSKTGD